MSGVDIDPAHILKKLEDILDSDPNIDELGFLHPSQYDALNEDVHSSSSASAGKMENETTKVEPVDAANSDAFFWYNEHKLGISTFVLVPLYKAAKAAFMEALKRYKILSNAQGQENELLDGSVSVRSASMIDNVENEVMKHSKVLVLLSCDFGTVWNFRKLIMSKKQLLPLYIDELLLSTLVLSHSPKSERAWNQRKWVIKMISGICSNLQEIVQSESELVKNIVENYKMNYRAWNHRCWLVSYMADSQVLCELRNSRDWAGLHVADNSCFHYRARLLLQMVENLRDVYAKDEFSSAEFAQIWKEELDWVWSLIKRYVGREALWLHRRFLSLIWTRHLTLDDQRTFIKHEFELFRSCATIPDNQFGDYQAQATYAATYIVWLAKQLPSSFGVEICGSSQNSVVRKLVGEAGKSFLWDSLTEREYINGS